MNERLRFVPDHVLQPTNPKQLRPHIGVGVMVVRNGSVLIGKRTGSHGAGHWAFPGGHVEFGETWWECGEREVLEETGMIVKCQAFDPLNLQKAAFITENIMKGENRHYNTVFLWANWVSGDPVVSEESKIDKTEGWQWVTVRELMNKMPEEAIRAYEQGNFHDALHWFPLTHISLAHRTMGWQY